MKNFLFTILIFLSLVLGNSYNSQNQLQSADTNNAVVITADVTDEPVFENQDCHCEVPNPFRYSL